MSLKNVLIFGDSYSTFQDWIPKENSIYYFDGGSDTDVTRVTETWWHRVLTATDSKLILNDSFSGSTIGHTGYNNADCSETYSFICRLKRLIDKGFFKENKIDTVFVFGGTNDSWSNAPLGAEKFSNFEKEDLYNVLPAISYFLMLLRQELPDAEIYCLINTELKPEITDTMLSACEKFGINAVEFDRIDKMNGHPTVKGMQDISDRILSVIKK